MEVLQQLQHSGDFSCSTGAAGLRQTTAVRGKQDGFRALGGEVISGRKTGVPVSMGQAASAHRNWPVSLHGCGEIP